MCIHPHVSFCHWWNGLNAFPSSATPLCPSDGAGYLWVTRSLRGRIRAGTNTVTPAGAAAPSTGPAGGAAAPPGGPARGRPPAPDTHARPRPRRFVPGRSPGSSPRVSHGAVIHRRVPAPGPGEPQGAGAAVWGHPQPPRGVPQLFGPFYSERDECGGSARELTVPVDGLVRLNVGV